MDSWVHFFGELHTTRLYICEELDPSPNLEFQFHLHVELEPKVIYFSLRRD